MIERVELVLTPEGVNANVRDAACVVLDVLRATSVLVTSLANGARAALAEETVEAAFAAAARIGPGALLCGERDSDSIEGFALGNSPWQFTPEVVHGKTLVITTTNGTRAIQAVLNHAEEPFLLCGALLNAGAVAFELDTAEPTRAVLVCAGTRGHFSQEDFVGAGAVVANLAAWPEGQIECDDAVTAAVALYEGYRDDLAALVRRGSHAQHLIEKGYERDVRDCAALDRYSVVPRWNGTAFIGDD